MKPFIENLVNDNTKKITRLNFNYFFSATVFIILLNIILQAANALKYLNVVVLPDWDKFSVNNLLQSLFNSYLHFNWQHCLLNMLCFFIAGLYLERKMGSIRFIMFIFILSLFTAFASSTNAVSLNWRGFSGVNYGLYGYIIIEFLFVLFRKNKRTRFNIIMGASI